MSEVRQSTFIISREDRAEDPKTIIGEGLRIGRLPDSDIWLNHPHVSRLHAGINGIDENFFLINVSASSPTTLNGRVVSFNEVEAIVHGDEIQIGPFFLRIAQLAERLGVTVGSQIAVDVGERETGQQKGGHERQRIAKTESGSLVGTGPLDSASSEKLKRQSAESESLSNALKVFWNKRTREKAGRPSPLHPRKPPRLGKARFNWMPTRDLVRPWPFAVFVWAAVVVAAFAVLAVYAQKNV